MSSTRAILAAIALILPAAASGGAAAQSSADPYEELSLEEILQANVTSVAKRPQRVEESAAAVFVISREDIRRSGVTTLPELFRMVPGMEVASLASGNAAVTARGFNGRFSNKLLVLVDGRAIYLSTLSGVLWDQQLPPVEDIERIEVVRGPGATLWGANAVNGVINVVTKHAADSLGVLAGARYSSDEDGRVVFRLGTTAGDSGALRAYVVGHRSEGAAFAVPDRRHDVSSAIQAGFRFDFEPNARDSFTLQGDVQTGESDLSQIAPPPSAAMAALPVGVQFSGQNLLGRWTRTDDGRVSSVQVYWDRLERREAGLDGVRDQADIDFSQHFSLGERHQIVWGAGYRWSSDHVEVLTPAMRFSPEARRDHWYGAYVSDEISLVPDHLRLSLGAKVEHNDYTGFEFQPSVRLAWTDSGGWTAWGAVSQAVRTPSRLETALEVHDPIVAISAAGDLKAEELLAWEIGWRGKLGPAASLDLTAYHHQYENLVIWNATPAMGPGQPFITLEFANGGRVESSGVEAALDARLTDRWTVKIAASAMDMNVLENGFLVGGLETFSAGVSPRHQLSVRSWFDVTDTIDLDLWVRHVPETSGGIVKAYTDLDIRAAWRPTPSLELYVLAENLTDRERLEIIETGLGSPSAFNERRVWFGVAARY
ncbi:TonB-dependent receptor [Brevundimonas sp.]|uniref:TonB-dependent receptor plug domain-containing protein n=1 Tax=Brevundimonas sp. TaxID=1871086 RepID=UPI002D709E53|nr:TonB-dependent receptor [Brevundimonas sp.]HYC73940.1 TonB-dependent receptor [Brevundimonas sp.]